MPYTPCTQSTEKKFERDKSMSAEFLQKDSNICSSSKLVWLQQRTLRDQKLKAMSIEDNAPADPNCSW